MLTLSGAGQPQNGGAGIEERFVISVKTDNAGTSADNEFTLPWIGTYDVDWGDGTSDSGVTNTQTHTYASAGTYDVAVTAATGRVQFSSGGDKSKVIDIKNWGTCAWTSMNSAFYGCNSLTDVSAVDIINLTNCTSLQAMFRSSSVSQINTSNWDVSNITSLYQTFTFCSNIQSLDVSNWDVSNVNAMESLFRGMTALTTLDVSSWDTSNVSNSLSAARFIFQDSPNVNPDISNWVLGSNNLEKMLEDSDSFDRSLANWDISSTPNLINFMQNASGMSTANYDATLISWASQNPTPTNANFGGSKYSYEAASARQTLIDTYGWTITDGGQVASPEFALKWETTTPNEEVQLGVGSGTFDYVIDWGDGTVESYNTDANISHTYADAGDHITKITGDFPHMNMQNLTDDVYREKLRDVLNWGTIVWQDWDNMFRNCSGFTALTATDLPNLSNVTSFVYLVSGSNFGYHYNPTVQNWDVSNVTNMSGFSHYGRWRNKISTWDTSNVTNFTNFLRSNGNFDNGGDLADMDNFNVSSAITMNWMLNRCYLMANVYIGSWDVSNVTSFNTFANPMIMTNSGLENWNISNASNFNQFNAYGQTNISLANWTPTSMTSGQQFWFSNNAMSVANYDATLISWAGQTLQNNVTFDFGSSQYTLGGAAEAARNTLINTYGWTITDGGGIFVGVLDTYPNASAAYSLRDLASASVGSAVVRVRRSSDNTEQDFTATEITDGTLTTFTGVNDGFVTVWYDQSTNSNNAIQPTATRQPQIVDSGVVILENNNPSIKFDNTNDGFTLTSTINGGQYSIFTVDKPINLGVYQSQYFTDSISNPRQYILRNLTGYNTNGSFNIYRNTILDNSITNGFQELMYFESTVNTTNKIDVLFARQNYIDGWGSTFQEIIIYPTNQSANKTGIEANINSKYKVYGDVFVSGLLFDYPDAKAAFSLRQLGFYQNGYEPLAVRVRRSSDNTEQDFTSAEITDGTLTTFTGANDGFVSVWYDQSGNSNNASQNGLTTRQPQIVSNGNVILENGKPAIELNISNQILGLKSDILGGQYSIFTVDKTNGGGYFTDGPSPRQYISKKQNLSSYEINGNFDIYRNSVLDSSIYTNSQELLYFKSNTTTTNVIRTILNNGGSTEALLGNVQEMVIYDTDQSANRTGIETNINTEYTIYEVPVYTDNLVASYSFDTDFSDYTGNNDLTASGDATAGVAIGKVNDCLEVDGVDDYSIAVDSNDFSFTNGSNDLPFSISVWANGDNLGTGNLVNKRNVGSYFEYQVFILSSQVVVNLFNQGSASSQLKTRVYGTYNNNTWYNIIVTYDGSGNNSGLKVYVNGVLPTQTLDPVGTYVGMSNTTSPFTIGSFASGVDDFDGKIDEVHVWKNRELTSAEVLEIYNTENAGNSILP